MKKPKWMLKLYKRKEIQNHQFQQLFLKNWCMIFMYMIIPLVVFMGIVWFYSQKMLLEEIDAAAERSTNSTVATINSLMEEADNILEKTVIDEAIYNFLCEKYTLPVPYSFVKSSVEALEIIRKEERPYLYYSVDAYSEISEYLVSTQMQGIRYDRLYDKGIVDEFQNYRIEHPSEKIFAISRIYKKQNTNPQRGISIYKIRKLPGEKYGFVSISIDIEKLCKYIVDEQDYVRQRYLIIDNMQNVIMDTAGILDNEKFMIFQDSMENISLEIDGKEMRAFVRETDYFDWKCVQLVSLEDIQRSSVWIRKLSFLLVMLAAIVAVVLSYKATSKLFKPIEAILQLIENPTRDFLMQDEKGEIQYLLISILELFEKNIVLEKESLERVTSLRRTRAKALQEQMTPHFLSNVLQAINWLAIEETKSEDSKTCKSIVLLADIVCTVKGQTTNLTTVASEMEYIKKFFELERLRFGPEINFYYNVAADAEVLPIPCISLQTLVENSIIHGLQPKGAKGNIYVLITNAIAGGLIIRVEDDGIGMSQEKIDKIWELTNKDYIYLGEHLGIVNLFQRFRLIYGEECEFDIRKSRYGGVCVEIVTPKLPTDYMLDNK